MKRNKAPSSQGFEGLLLLYISYYLPWLTGSCEEVLQRVVQ